MNKGMLTVGIILLSIIALLLINVLNNYMTGSELDYYLVKETTDAALEDAIDSSYQLSCGLTRIDKERFVESFVYRFANSVEGNRDYKLSFYDINEVPPKVSVRVDSMTVLSFGSGDLIGSNSEKVENQAADITTTYSAIVENKNISDVDVEKGLRPSEQGSVTYSQCRPQSELIK